GSALGATPLTSPIARTVARIEIRIHKAGHGRHLHSQRAFDMSDQAIFCGIDVSKDHLDVALLPSGEGWQVTNDPSGIGELLEKITPLAPALTVLEATGGYETQVAAALAHAGLALAIVNPRQVRDFAKATGQLAKTDRIDAKVIALFADRIRPKPQTLKDDEARLLDALLTRRTQLVGMRSMEKNRRS